MHYARQGIITAGNGIHCHPAENLGRHLDRENEDRDTGPRRPARIPAEEAFAGRRQQDASRSQGFHPAHNTRPIHSALRFLNTSPQSSCANEVAGGRAIDFLPTLNHPESEAEIIGRNFLVKDQRQHRQLLPFFVIHRRRGEKIALEYQVWVRPRDGSFPPAKTIFFHATREWLIRQLACAHSAPCQSTRLWKKCGPARLKS